MAGLVPAIHDGSAVVRVDARDTGERGDAVLRTAMPGHDGVCAVRFAQTHIFLAPPPSAARCFSASAAAAAARPRVTGSRISGPVVAIESVGLWKKRWPAAMPRKFGYFAPHTSRSSPGGALSAVTTRLKGWPLKAASVSSAIEADEISARRGSSVFSVTQAPSGPFDHS